MLSFKWSYDGEFFECYSSAGEVLHKFDKKQMEEQKIICERMPSYSMVFQLVKEYEQRFIDQGELNE